MESEDQKDRRQERESLQVAVQEVVREFHDEGVVVKCLVIMEVGDKDGSKHLSTRSFDVNGENMQSWDVLGFCQDTIIEVEHQRIIGALSE